MNLLERLITATAILAVVHGASAGCPPPPSSGRLYSARLVGYDVYVTDETSRTGAAVRSAILLRDDNAPATIGPYSIFGQTAQIATPDAIPDFESGYIDFGGDQNARAKECYWGTPPLPPDRTVPRCRTEQRSDANYRLKQYTAHALRSGEKRDFRPER